MVLHGVEAITTWIICHFSKTVPIEFTNVASIYFYQHWEGDEMKWKWWLLVTHSFYENNSLNSCCCNRPCVLFICVSFSEPCSCIFIGAVTYQYDGVVSICYLHRAGVGAHQLWVSLSNFRQKEPWNWIVAVNRIRTWTTLRARLSNRFWHKCWMNFPAVIKWCRKVMLCLYHCKNSCWGLC